MSSEGHLQQFKLVERTTHRNCQNYTETVLHVQVSGIVTLESVHLLNAETFHNASIASYCSIFHVCGC